MMLNNTIIKLSMSFHQQRTHLTRSKPGNYQIRSNLLIYIIFSHKEVFTGGGSDDGDDHTGDRIQTPLVGMMEIFLRLLH
jgi:hypothetical protein